MILYHAGPSWVHVAEAAMVRTDLAKRLCDSHGFTQCMLYEPFGRDRGAVIAKRGHMLVMAIGADGGNTWFSVAPSKALQDLIWSFSNGFAGQWAPWNLRPSLVWMTGRRCSKWPVASSLQRCVLSSAPLLASRSRMCQKRLSCPCSRAIRWKCRRTIFNPSTVRRLSNAPIEIDPHGFPRGS